MLFNPGKFIMTREIYEVVKKDGAFFEEIINFLRFHVNGDWGNLCDEDKKRNDLAVKEGDRIISAYDTEKGKIWIITEWDRSATTILFPSEY